MAASLFFYGWWNPAYLGLLVGSILFNYSIGVGLAMGSSDSTLGKKGLLVAGIAGNLAAIGYFKYANFFVNAINQGFNTEFDLAPIILPLAISFFTFQQIAYLVDVYRGETREHNFLQYCLFVTFFPQLIAGPIVHHKEMLHQFAKDSLYKFKHENFSIGITIFFIGLFKKVMIADTVAQFSTPVFNAAASGTIITFLKAGARRWHTPSSCILIFQVIPTWLSAWAGCSGYACRLTLILRIKPPALLTSGGAGI